MQTITAFTEIDYPEEAYYPGYVNFSADVDFVEISVRSTGSDETSFVRVPVDEWIRMVDDMVRSPSYQKL